MSKATRALAQAVQDLNRRQEQQHPRAQAHALSYINRPDEAVWA